jgi:hypothetical protein
VFSELNEHVGLVCYVAGHMLLHKEKHPPAAAAAAAASAAQAADSSQAVPVTISDVAAEINMVAVT